MKASADGIFDDIPTPWKQRFVQFLRNRAQEFPSRVLGDAVYRHAVSRVGRFARRNSKVHALYLKSSAARGTWIPGLSDIDVCFILKKGVSAASLLEFVSELDRFRNRICNLGILLTEIECMSFELWDRFERDRQCGESSYQSAYQWRCLWSADAGCIQAIVPSADAQLPRIPWALFHALYFLNYDFLIRNQFVDNQYGRLVKKVREILLIDSTMPPPQDKSFVSLLRWLDRVFCDHGDTHRVGTPIETTLFPFGPSSKFHRHLLWSLDLENPQLPNPMGESRGDTVVQTGVSIMTDGLAALVMTTFGGDLSPELESFSTQTYLAQGRGYLINRHGDELLDLKTAVNLFGAVSPLASFQAFRAFSEETQAIEKEIDRLKGSGSRKVEPLLLKLLGVMARMEHAFIEGESVDAG